ncbi:MAG TPA: argininosuccinate lyase [Chloroflexota bacterium]|nr:argininosuccinate lyase [Chloroflexota bacterium]
MKTWVRGPGPDGESSRLNLQRFERFSSSIQADVRLARFDVRCSQVHARALTRADVLSAEEAAELERGLSAVLAEIEAGTLQLRDDLEDIHTHVEARLSQLLGPLAGALHTGRSRNDQIATDLRLFTRQSAIVVSLGICDVVESLLHTAGRSQALILPGYTHLQRGQPILLAHYLLAHVEMLKRDLARFGGVWEVADACPLGSGAVAGAGFRLDRKWMASELGFSGPTSNSVDAVADRDFLADFLFAGSQLMVHLSRLAEDLIIWSSSEFSFVVLPDEFSTGSSMMPQKRNPDALELVRGFSGRLLGSLVATLSTLKGLPMAYDRDLQVLTPDLLASAEVLSACLGVVAPLVEGLRFDESRMVDAADSFALATDLADGLVRSGLPFREAHHRVSELVDDLIQQGRTLGDLRPEKLADSLEIELEDAASLLPLGPRRSIEARVTEGSTNPGMVYAALTAASASVEDQRRTWSERGRVFEKRMSPATP